MNSPNEQLLETALIKQKQIDCEQQNIKIIIMKVGQKKRQKQNEKQIQKLQKQITNFENQLNIQAKEQEIIKNYQMSQGNYQILITIYQANQLMPRGTNFLLFSTNKTACDAFIEIQINNQVQKTAVKKDTNNPIFDQKFYYKFANMTIQQLDKATISFKLYDKKKFILKDSLIGSFQLDWTNVYFKRNHQIYRGWLTLMDPFDQQEGVMGYLLVNIAILGDNDKVTIHDSAFIKDPLTTIQDTITMPKLQLIDYGINVEIYRAQNLVPLDEFSGNVDGYVIVKFSGNKMDTSVKTSCNPQWDELIQIGTGVPTKSKYVTLEVRNKNYITGDDIIGVINIPFIDLAEQSQPRWGHLYGPPVSGKDYAPYNYQTKMQLYGQKMGSHYRGRILYKITGKKDLIHKNARNKISFKFPFKPTPIVSLKSYILRIQILDGFNLTQIQNKKLWYIHACIGQYMLVSKGFGQVKNRSVVCMQKLTDKKVQFPQDPSQIPDLIIYLAHGEKQKDRISYIRIQSKNLISIGNTKKMIIYNLKTDLSLRNCLKNQPGGSITARVHLFTGLPPQMKTNLQNQFSKKNKFLIKIFLYRAKNLPPMNQNGDCDPKLVFHFCGTQKSVQSDSTYNPIFNKVINIQVQTQDFMTIDIQKALICNVYDVDEKQLNLIGNFMVYLSKKHKRKYQGVNKKIDFLYQKPQWYPILNDNVDVGDPCFGHVLMGCAVFRNQDLGQFKNCQLEVINQINQKKQFQLFLLGARNLSSDQNYLDHKFISFQIKIGKSLPFVTKQCQVKGNSANINQMISFNVQVPKNKSIIPYMDIKIFQRKGNFRNFVSFTSINLYQLVPQIVYNYGNKQINNDSHRQQKSQQTVIDLDELQRQLDIVRERKKRRANALLKDGEYRPPLPKSINIQQMPVPKQLILTSTADEMSQKNAKLDELLLKFEEQYQNDPQYNYVANLQHQLDEVSNSKISQKYSNLNQIQKINYYKQQSQHQQQNIYANSPENTAKVFKSENKNNNKRNSKKKYIISLNQQIINGEELEQDVKKRVVYNNSQDSLKDGYIDLSRRFESDTDERRKIKPQQQSQQQLITNFNIDANQDIKQVKYDEKVIRYTDLQRIIKQQQKFTKQAMQRQQNYKYAAAVKLSLFTFKKKKQALQHETYQDYDTDPQQALDIIPQWYKGRKILASDFQQLVPNKKIISMPLYQGGSRIGNLDIRNKVIVGHLKCIGVPVTEQFKDQKQKKYLSLLKSRAYVCRVYVLKGKSLISNFNKKPNTYLKMCCKGEVYDLKSTTYREEDYNPQYYICQEIPMDVPGASTVRIEVIESTKVFGIPRDKILGFTQIDIQERQFTKKWHLFTDKKPIQLRNLYSQYGNGTQGRLQIWVDIIQKKSWLSNPPYRIHPPPYDKFELRVIVWSTKQCVYKNQLFQSNDIYVRGFLGVLESQETDTHWACRAVGNFNWRFKFQVSYPPKPQDMYSDQFVIQIWDRDVVGYNNLIGQRRININKIHRIIQKAVKRKKAIKAKMKIREKGLALTEKFWFDVFNHKVKDQFGLMQSQGKVQLSFQLVTIKEAQGSLKNGFGRADPNVFPTLQQPSGRLNFNILHPLDFFKQLCGPDLYKSICRKMICFVICILFGLLFYFFGGQLIANVIVKL